MATELRLHSIPNHPPGSALNSTKHFQRYQRSNFNPKKKPNPYEATRANMPRGSIERQRMRSTTTGTHLPSEQFSQVSFAKEKVLICLRGSFRFVSLSQSKVIPCLDMVLLIFPRLHKVTCSCAYSFPASACYSTSSFL